ncbi:13527_t:CDS:2 [Ambispora leptoticha]|uniref:13527_t:CDS:1 n=1 Tax=Ambispora leptoticha TaxID=144679 RepID=A0A9N8ZND1_9GLOM|nr:13527_t:CDS:2 [Ambispora leptoticha]
MAVSVANYQSDPTQGKLTTLVYDDENVSLVNFLPQHLPLSIYENIVAQQTTTTTGANIGKQTTIQSSLPLTDRITNGGNIASRHSMYLSNEIHNQSSRKIRRRAASYIEYSDSNHIRTTFTNNRHNSMPTPQIYEETYIGAQIIEAIPQKVEIVTRAAAPQQSVETEVVGIDGEKNRVKDQQQLSSKPQRTQSTNNKSHSRGRSTDNIRRRSDGVIYNKKNRNSSNSNNSNRSYSSDRNDVDSERARPSSISSANGDTGVNFKKNYAPRRRFNTAPASSSKRRTFIDISSLFKNDKKESSDQNKNTQQKNTSSTSSSSSSSSSSEQRRKKRQSERKKKRISDDLKDVSFANAETITNDDFDENEIKNQEMGGSAGVGVENIIPPRSSSIPTAVEYHYSSAPQQLHLNQFQQLQQSDQHHSPVYPQYRSDNINNEVYTETLEDHEDEDDIQAHRPFSLPPPSKQRPTLKRLSAPTSIIKNINSNNNLTFTTSPVSYDPQAQNNPYSNHLFQASHSVPSLAAIRDTDVTPSPSTPSLKRIQFSSTIFIHDTWTKEDYDRRGDQTTCNKLTPMLAQRIKQELNEYKLSEMPVHEESKQNTHFFA